VANAETAALNFGRRISCRDTASPANELAFYARSRSLQRRQAGLPPWHSLHPHLVEGNTNASLRYIAPVNRREQSQEPLLPTLRWCLAAVTGAVDGDDYWDFMLEIHPNGSTSEN